ncbi:hypothetical protein [Cupriavidus necator]|uniref:hypothetical protein n=1 Tax=Cupriavidus necator TaxID=106590 RepID=UPI0039C3AE55
MGHPIGDEASQKSSALAFKIGQPASVTQAASTAGLISHCPNSRLPTTSTWLLVSIRSVCGTVPVVQAVVHRLAADQHIIAAGFSSAPAMPASAALRRYTCREAMATITMMAADAEGTGRKLKVSCHGNRTG